MVEIRYLGHAGFYIRSKQAKLVIDPFSPEVGFAMKKVEADVVLVSHNHFDHSYVDGVKGDFVVINGPGEYEVLGVKVRGFKTYHDKNKGAERGVNTLYSMKVDGISAVHVGDLGHVLENGIIEELGEVDVLFVPVGGFFTLELSDVVKLVEQIEPRIIIPMHYKTKEHSQTFEKIAGIEPFLQEMGVKEWEAVDKLVLKKDEEVDRVVVMKRWK
ncbi:MAG: MBL fold metallo-hydrolase [bacterium]|nr:MBL fold metallo-hydrolase [bacterium]